MFISELITLVSLCSQWRKPGTAGVWFISCWSRCLKWVRHLFLSLSSKAAWLRDIWGGGVRWAWVSSVPSRWRQLAASWAVLESPERCPVTQLWAGGWSRWPPQVLSSLNYSVNLFSVQHFWDCIQTMISCFGLPVTVRFLDANIFFPSCIQTTLQRSWT